MSESYDICMVRCDAQRWNTLKTNRATRYVGPRVAGCALCYRVVTYYLTLTTGNSLSIYATLTNRHPAIRYIYIYICQ